MHLGTVLAVLTLVEAYDPVSNVRAMPEQTRLRLQAETKSLWQHGYSSYMTYAYPEDELRPLSCRGQGRDHNNPGNYARNDVNGDYSLTFLDILSTLPLLKNEKEFVKAVDKVIRDVRSFDRDVKVQVFEVTIRILGSLLSSYQQLIKIEKRDFLASHDLHPQGNVNGSTAGESVSDGIIGSFLRAPSYLLKSITNRVSGAASFHQVPPLRQEFITLPVVPEGSTSTQRRSYHRQRRKALLSSFKRSNRATALLNLAVDLGDRLLPAFVTPTSMPYARVNLRHGVEDEEIEETCAAATTSLILEMVLLSELTGNPTYGAAAESSFHATWNRRAPSTGLVGNQIGVHSGQWMLPGTSGIGAGIDSFFEYALKGAVLFDADDYMNIWDDSYRSVMQHVRAPDGYMFRNVHMRFGVPVGSLLDSLSAFWPGLQVVAGNIEDAIKSHLVYWHLWQKHSAMPEGFNYVNKTLEWAGYPLRPEFIESTYWLYRATRDDFYLEVGQRILKDLKRRTKVGCGFAVLHNIQTGAREDRMESFMLSETLKYLYLLFDLDNSVNQALEGSVFTTEGHVLERPNVNKSRLSIQARESRRKEFNQSEIICLKHQPFSINGLKMGIQHRFDYDYTRNLVDMPLLESDYWNRWGFCKEPIESAYHFEISLNTTRSAPPIYRTQEELITAQSQWDPYIERFEGDLLISDLTNTRGRVTRARNGKDLVMTSVGNHRVHAGQMVFLNDLDNSTGSSTYPTTFPGISAQTHQKEPSIEADRPWNVIVTFSSRSPNYTVDGISEHIWRGYGAPAYFGKSVRRNFNEGDQYLSFNASPLLLRKPSDDDFGCANDSYARSSGSDNRRFVAFALRGNCSFQQKHDIARSSGAAGIVVWGNDKSRTLIQATMDPELANTKHTNKDISMVYVPRQMGKLASAAMDQGKDVYVELNPQPIVIEERDPIAFEGSAVETSYLAEQLANAWNNVFQTVQEEEVQGQAQKEAPAQSVPVQAIPEFITRQAIASVAAKYRRERRAGREKASEGSYQLGLTIAGQPITNVILLSQLYL